jgi:hypothetical protein
MANLIFNVIREKINLKNLYYRIVHKDYKNYHIIHGALTIDVVNEMSETTTLNTGYGVWLRR